MLPEAWQAQPGTTTFLESDDRVEVTCNVEMRGGCASRVVDHAGAIDIEIEVGNHGNVCGQVANPGIMIAKCQDDWNRDACEKGFKVGENNR